MRQQVTEASRWAKRVYRSFTVIRSNVVHRPVAVEHSAVHQQVAVHLKLAIHLLHTEVMHCINRVFELNFDVECVSSVAPFQRPHCWPIGTLIIHFHAGCLSTVEQTKVHTRLFGLAAIGGFGCIGCFLCGDVHDAMLV